VDREIQTGLDTIDEDLSKIINFHFLGEVESPTLITTTSTAIHELRKDPEEEYFRMVFITLISQ
jgi:hypothetical protein